MKMARVLFVSLHQSPLYPGTGRVEERGARGGEGTTVNVPMPPGSGPAAYGAAFRELVLPVLRAFDAELVLVSSGFDAHRRDPLAQLELDADCFGAMTTALLEHVEEAGHGLPRVVSRGWLRLGCHRGRRLVRWRRRSGGSAMSSRTGGLVRAEARGIELAKAGL